MKKIASLIFLASFLFLGFSSAKEECSSCKELQEIQMAFSQKIRRSDEQNHALVMKAVSAIEKATKKMKAKQKDQILSEVVTLLSMTNSFDSYHITAEAASTAYSSNKKIFEKHLKKLSKPSQAAVRKSLEMVMREAKQGNG